MRIISPAVSLDEPLHSKTCMATASLSKPLLERNKPGSLAVASLAVERGQALPNLVGERLIARDPGAGGLGSRERLHRAEPLAAGRDCASRVTHGAASLALACACGLMG
jgi:hypothetical protein